MDPTTEEAAAQLRTIRALMERATVYQAISAPAALFAGVTALGLCAWLQSLEQTASRPGPVVFIGIWVALLVLASVVNFALLYRSARQRGEPFVSSGMKHALQAVLPPLAGGFILGLIAATEDTRRAAVCYADIASYWILFYGLALLATGSFAPKPMQALGAGFFFMGVLTFMPTVRQIGGDGYHVGLLYMAVSFGFLHIVYAAAVFLQNRRLARSLPE